MTYARLSIYDIRNINVNIYDIRNIIQSAAVVSDELESVLVTH